MTMNDTNIFAMPEFKVSTGRNSIAIGSGLSVNQDYELVIGGLVRDEIRVVMTPEEHVVVERLLRRAVSNGS